MRISFFILITLILHSCSNKIYVEHYARACDSPGIEYGDLCLFDDGRFILATNNCNRYLYNSADCFGYYRKIGDSIVALSAEDYSIDHVRVNESKTIDSAYQILIKAKDGEGFINESMQLIINEHDTLNWLQKNFIPFNANKPTIYSIQLLLNNLNYSSPIYHIKNLQNNQIEFQLKAPWQALTTFPSQLILNNFVLQKKDSTLTAPTAMPGRMTPINFKLIYKGKRNPKKLIKRYFDGNKHFLGFVGSKDDRVTNTK